MSFFTSAVIFYQNRMAERISAILFEKLLTDDTFGIDEFRQRIGF